MAQVGRVLRCRALAWHPRARRRRRVDQPVDSYHRPAALDRRPRGPNIRLHRQAPAPAIEGEDTVVASLRFENGALGVVEAATSVYPGFKRRLELTGTEGTVILDGDNITTWALKDGSANPLPPTTDVSNGSANPMAIDCEGHHRVMEDFVAAI